MSTSPLIWQLPGPNGFVREIKKSARRGQHVAAVLPRAYFDEYEHAEWLIARWSTTELKVYRGRELTEREVREAFVER